MLVTACGLPPSFFCPSIEMSRARFQLLDHAAFLTPGTETPFVEFPNDAGITGATGYRIFTSTSELLIRDMNGELHNLLSTLGPTGPTGPYGIVNGSTIYPSAVYTNDITASTLTVSSIASVNSLTIINVTYINSTINTLAVSG